MKFGYKDKDFRKKFELWCHLVPNGFALATGLALLIKEYFNAASKSCYIGAKPMYCMYSQYVECERGDEYAMMYALWFSGLPFFIVFFVMVIFTLMIIHSLVLMKQKRDRWTLSSGNENESSTRIWFKCLAAFVTFPSKLKKLFEKNTENSPSKSQVQTHSSRSVLQKSTSYKNGKVISMLNVFDYDFDEEKQSLDNTPNTKLAMNTLQEPPSSETKQTSRASYNRVDTKDLSLSSSASAEEEKVQLCPEVQKKTYVAASRSGNASDPYAFDLKKVRQSIRAEALNESNADSLQETNKDLTSKATTPLRRLSALRTSTNTSLSREEGAIKHSLTYLIGYFLCYTPILIIGFLQMSRTEYPYVITIISRCMLTLHGPVFLLTYTRPYVRSIRRNHDEYSWFGAFWMVFKSGGDDDR